MRFDREYIRWDRFEWDSRYMLRFIIIQTISKVDRHGLFFFLVTADHDNLRQVNFMVLNTHEHSGYSAGWNTVCKINI